MMWGPWAATGWTMWTQNAGSTRDRNLVLRLVRCRLAMSSHTTTRSFGAVPAAGYKEDDCVALSSTTGLHLRWGCEVINLDMARQPSWLGTHRHGQSETSSSDTGHSRIICCKLIFLKARTMLDLNGVQFPKELSYLRLFMKGESRSKYPIPNFTP